MRSLQRVVHRLGGYVRGLERCVRLQAIAKTALCSCAFWFETRTNRNRQEMHQSNKGGVSCKARPLREGLRTKATSKQPPHNLST